MQVIDGVPPITEVALRANYLILKENFCAKSPENEREIEIVLEHLVPPGAPPLKVSCDPKGATKIPEALFAETSQTPEK